MASEMNCAGYCAANSSAPRYGYPNCANGIAPESYQASVTSSTRRAVAPHPQARVTSSTKGRCGSSSLWSIPVNLLSSANEPGRSGVPRGTARSAAACPSSAAGTAPSRRCWPTSRRTGRASRSPGARWSVRSPATRRSERPWCGCTRTAGRSRAKPCGSAPAVWVAVLVRELAEQQSQPALRLTWKPFIVR